MNNMYIALDFPTWQETAHFLDEHKLHGAPVKVGMELFYKEGLMVVEKLKENNHPIFLDLKLHDIPTTVMRAMKNLAMLDVDILNVHAFGGSEMISRAKEGLLAGKSSGKDTALIAVTILTSMEQGMMNSELRINGELEAQVMHLAEVSKNSGADGVVCSVHEANQVKAVCGSDFLTVTPGIRLEQSDNDDQKRVATPKYAKANGADILVIGRSITLAEDPLKAYEQALKEWQYGN